MKQFYFRSWLSEHGDLYWEGVRDISKLPMDKIELQSLDAEDNDEFEEEEFDSDSAWDSCSDNIDVDSDEVIYDDPDEDEDFNQQSPDSWEEENPEPDREQYKTDEEHTAAIETWKQEYDEVEKEYNVAVKNWKNEMNRRRDSQDEARTEAISDCVDEMRSEHESQEEERRERHEEERRESDEGKGGYSSQFTIDNDTFDVTMSREKVEYERTDLENVFGVTFRGPNGYSLTNKNTGREAIQRYNYLIASVAKMVEVEKSKGRKVNGFTFYPADPAMGLMYQKFYTDYLKPNGYLRVTSELYLTKDYIREVMSDLPDYKKKSAYSKITDTHRSVKDQLKKVRDKKALMRVVKLELSKLVGKLILITKPYYNDTLLYPGFVRDRSVDYIAAPGAYIVFYDRYLDEQYVPYNNIFDSTKQPKLNTFGTPTPEQAVSFLELLSKEVIDRPDWFSHGDLSHFKQLLTQYGITNELTQDQPQVQPQQVQPRPHDVKMQQAQQATQQAQARQTQQTQAQQTQAQQTQQTQQTQAQ